MLIGWFSYLFATLLLVGAYQALTLEQRVHAVFSIITAFVCGAFFILISGADFIRILLLMVYVGAIARLFLFVVMTVPSVEHEVDWRAVVGQREPSTFRVKFLGLVLFFYCAYNLTFFLVPRVSNASISNYSIFSITFGQTLVDLPFYFLTTGVSSFSQLLSIAFYLYAFYPFVLLLRAVLLLVGMLRAILLTVHLRPVTRQQNLMYQVQRDARVL